MIPLLEGRRLLSIKQSIHTDINRHSELSNDGISHCPPTMCRYLVGLLTFLDSPISVRSVVQLYLGP
jgi:hypothetical protein